MGFMRSARLDRVHSELRAASREGAGTQVADSAVRYGFHNAGRLAAEYGLRIGESPSQTLRASVHWSLPVGPASKMPE